MGRQNLARPIGFFIAGVLIAAVLRVGLDATEPVLTDRPAVSGGERTGTIQGTVFYQSDSKRPWRYARYYIEDRKKGELAEAVIALASRTLEKQERPTASATVVVDQKDFRFVPETVAIRVGDRIKFLNSDKEVHNVQTFHPRHSFNVNMPAGVEHVETFNQASGIRRPYRIGCVYHSSMRAWVFALDHPYFQVTQAEGRFRLKNVPAGKHKLEMVHPAGQLRWSKTINVAAGKTTQIEIRVSPDDKMDKSS